MQVNSNCPFCNFSAPEVLIREDEIAFAIISLRPINKYHVLVVPIKHYEPFAELPDETASHIFLLAKRISAAVRIVCQPDAITHISDDDVTGIGQNLIAHYKFHIIPRFKDDKVVINWEREETDIQVRSKFADEIKEIIISNF